MIEIEPVYTTEAIATGAGRNGHVQSPDGRVSEDLAVPVEMGGSGKGTNPEQLFAAGYAACFHSALQMVARQAKRTLATPRWAHGFQSVRPGRVWPCRRPGGRYPGSAARRGPAACR